MRRVALYGIGWIAAAAVAVLLAWQGVGLVGRTVTDNHPRALTADEARQALGDGSAAGGASPDTGPATAIPTGADPPTGSVSTNSSTAARPRPTATTATTRPTSTAPTSSSTAPSSPPASGGTVRTYNLAGGSTALRFDPSGAVTVVWANPNPGFRADIDDRDGGGVRVRFDGDSGRSQVEAWWDGGPRDRVEEEGSGGGSGRG